MNNIYEQIAFFFSFRIIPCCILLRVGLLGHLKDENNLAQKDVMTCLGNTAQFSAGGKIVDNSRFSYFAGRIRQLFYYPYQRGGLQGSTHLNPVSLHVETHILGFDLTRMLLILTRIWLYECDCCCFTSEKTVPL